MLILAIDTSAAASVALVDGERLVAARTEFAARRHVEFIGPALAEVLAEAPRPDAVVVGIGPGPFTGLRAGIAAGIGAALGAGVPVHGVVSHDALALRALSTPGHGGMKPAGSVAEAPTSAVPAPGTGSSTAPGTDSSIPVAVATDARRREVYATVYSGLDGDGLPLVAATPAALDPGLLAAGLREAYGKVRRVGRGFELYRDVLGGPDEAEPEALDPTAEWLARVANRSLGSGRELSGTEPLYLREPDAKPSARRATLLT